MRRGERGEVLRTTVTIHTVTIHTVVHLLQLEAPEVCLTSPAASSPSEDMLGADLIKKEEKYIKIHFIHFCMAYLKIYHSLSLVGDSVPMECKIECWRGYF
jgi:hypothetical protein